MQNTNDFVKQEQRKLAYSAERRKGRMKSNVFVQPYEQKPNLFGLCHGEKTKDEIQRMISLY